MGKDLKKIIRNVPDFPKKGIVFRDITTLIGNSEALKDVLDNLSARYKEKKIDYIVSIESRGFIFGAALAYILNAGFVPVRKKGKLPSETHSITYDLEYGTDTLEIHKDAIESGKRVLVIDDLLATGGTASAVVDLVKRLGANVVEVAFAIELEFLKGREKLKGVPVYSLVKYDKE
ncbi:MAG: adenine phosphoribosyltransferase [Candidatus Omnitrophota bacterium]